MLCLSMLTLYSLQNISYKSYEGTRNEDVDLSLCRGSSMPCSTSGPCFHSRVSKMAGFCST